MSYDLPHKPVPKLMSSHDLVPIRDKLATGSQHQTLCECLRTIRDEVQFFVHNTVQATRREHLVTVST